MSDILYALGFYVEYADGGRAIVSVLCLLFIAYGVISCFYGYKVFKFITGVCGFLIGTVLGFVLAIATGGPDVSGPALIIPSILVGVIGAFLAVKLYYIGVFLIGALFGGLLGFVLTAASGDVQGSVMLLLAIIAGILSVIIKKFMIILSTAVSGAQTISTALYILLYAISGNEYDVINNFLWVILAVIGFFYQYSSNKNAPVDPVAQTNGDIYAPGSTNKGFQVFARYKKPLIIACIIILVFMLFGPRAPLGVVLLITAAAIALYLFIDRKSGGGTQAGSVSITSSAAGKTSVPAAAAGDSTGIQNSADTGSNQNKIECAACQTLNDAGSKFCRQCGASLENRASDDTQGSF